MGKWETERSPQLDFRLPHDRSPFPDGTFDEAF
jgi:hypothetical protein